MHQHLYLLVTTYTNTVTLQFYCSPLLNFAEKLEMNKKDNNSIFITEKRCDMKLFEFFSLYWVYIRSLNHNGSMKMNILDRHSVCIIQYAKILMHAESG